MTAPTVTACPIGRGNTTGYSYYRCRCPECTAAKVAADGARNDRRRGGRSLSRSYIPFGPLDQHRAARELNDTQMAAAISVSQTRVSRWRAEGRLTVAMADRAAIRLGCHPAEIWGTDWWADTWEAAS